MHCHYSRAELAAQSGPPLPRFGAAGVAPPRRLVRRGPPHTAPATQEVFLPHETTATIGQTHVSVAAFI